jgi:hypothetical protein
MVKTGRREIVQNFAAVLRICIIYMRSRIEHFTVMRIWIRPFSLIQIRILPFTLMMIQIWIRILPFTFLQIWTLK